MELALPLGLVWVVFKKPVGNKGLISLHVDVGASETGVYSLPPTLALALTAVTGVAFCLHQKAAAVGVSGLASEACSGLKVHTPFWSWAEVIRP
jgi:hypothetical protein